MLYIVQEHQYVEHEINSTKAIAVFDNLQDVSFAIANAQTRRIQDQSIEDDFIDVSYSYLAVPLNSISEGYKPLSTEEFAAKIAMVEQARQSYAESDEALDELKQRMLRDKQDNTSFP